MPPIDVRLAALYDIDNPDGPDHDHFRRRVDHFAPEAIIDLGCGTGILTTTLAKPGRVVTGIDPDVNMLDQAMHRPGAKNVRWVRGNSTVMTSASADLVLMTGNVAQHIGPSEWTSALADIARSLRSGGVVTFESRNPTAQAWRDWQRHTSAQTRETPFGRLTEWMEVTDPDIHGTVVLTAFNVFGDSNDEVVIVQPLTFRTRDQISADLAAVGLDVSNVGGGWHQERFADTSPVLVVEATTG